MGEEEMSEMSVEEHCNKIRAELKEIEKSVRTIPNHTFFQGEQAYGEQHGEMIAQSKLAVRAIEEARMRLGKVLQYAGDGVSIYDKI